MIWICGFLALYLLALLLVMWVSLHPPRIPIFLSPGAFGIPQQDVELRSKDGVRLSAWWCDHENARGIAVLSHGYMMNRSELATVALLLHQHGFACILHDFRGHGRSAKAVVSFGARERLDVVAAIEYAKSRRPNLPVVLIGSSMGSAASALALSENPSLAEALVLDSCFSRMASASVGWWRFLGGQLLAIVLAPVTVLGIPFAGVNPFKIDIARTLAVLKGKPVLILHGNADDLALPSEANRNQAACDAKLVWFDGCGHSEGRWLQPELYNTSLLEFLRQNGFCLD